MRSFRRVISPRLWRHAIRRSASDAKPRPVSTSSSTAPTQDVNSIASRLPKSLRPYASHFINQPVTHLTSFLFLHELTAVLPLGGFFYLFHTTQWSPPGLPGQWVNDGVEKFGKYARRKGWKWVDGENGARILLELATSYAIVKLLIPVRIGFSLWATPWFARTFLTPVAQFLRRLAPKAIVKPGR